MVINSAVTSKVPTNQSERRLQKKKTAQEEYAVPAHWGWRAKGTVSKAYHKSVSRAVYLLNKLQNILKAFMLLQPLNHEDKLSWKQNTLCPVCLLVRNPLGNSRKGKLYHQRFIHDFELGGGGFYNNLITFTACVCMLVHAVSTVNISSLAITLVQTLACSQTTQELSRDRIKVSLCLQPQEYTWKSMRMPHHVWGQVAHPLSQSNIQGAIINAGAKVGTRPTRSDNRHIQIIDIFV